jgi:hypothetical protein
MSLGGKNNANYGNQLDYHAGTGQLAMAAATMDQLFAGSEAAFMKKRGVIALLKEPAMDIVWIKTVSLDCSMHGVTFSTDGSLVMTHTAEATSHFIFIFDALDGTTKKSFSYTVYSGTYPLNTRNILLGSPVAGIYTGFAHTLRID